jgi:hypothetical protein
LYILTAEFAARQKDTDHATSSSSLFFTHHQTRNPPHASHFVAAVAVVFVTMPSPPLSRHVPLKREKKQENNRTIPDPHQKVAPVTRTFKLWYSRSLKSPQDSETDILSVHSQSAASKWLHWPNCLGERCRRRYLCFHALSKLRISRLKCNSSWSSRQILQSELRSICVATTCSIQPPQL